MSKPYAIISDVHLHNWSAFAEVTTGGRNSRLESLRAEILRAALTLQREGGDTLVVAGDLFHVRGSIAPSVLNPTIDTFQAIRKMGIQVHIIPGNHDLEGKDSERVTSAVTALEGIGCDIAHEITFIRDLVLVPWFDSVERLKHELELLVDLKSRERDLIIHAPINGVIMGIPDHGLDPEWLQKLGFRSVFAGHYHNHKHFPGTSVFSIGALAHHTWSDVNSTAGFLLVHADGTVKHYPSILPSFVDLDADIAAKTPEEIAQAIEGNYVRVKMDTTKIADLNKMREWLTEQGAKGQIVISVKKPVEERNGGVTASVRAGASIQQSVSDFIKGMGLTDTKAVELEAMKVLAEAEVV